jgi:hypothetical protein
MSFSYEGLQDIHLNNESVALWRGKVGLVRKPLKRKIVLMKSDINGKAIRT